MYRNNLRFFSENGATLFEVMATALVFVALSALAVPNLVELKGSFERHRGKAEFQSAIREAKARAVSEGTRAILNVSTDGASYTFGFDLVPFNDPPKEDSTESIRDLPENVTLSLSNPVVFNSQGYLIDETGSLANVNAELKYFGDTYCKATVYASGYTDYNCQVRK